MAAKNSAATTYYKTDVFRESGKKGAQGREGAYIGVCNRNVCASLTQPEPERRRFTQLPKRKDR